MTIGKLYNGNGVTISELVEYLQAEYLDRNFDGQVQIVDRESNFLGCVTEATMVLTSGVRVYLIVGASINPCIDIYNQSSAAPRLLDADTVEFTENLRRRK